MLKWRRNAKKRGKEPNPPYFPKYKEDICVCIHVEREFHAEEDVKDDPEYAELLFEDQFSSAQLIESDDGIYRIYLLCPQCQPESLEQFYLEIYRDLFESGMKPKSKYKKVLTWLQSKDLTITPLRNILRTHALGVSPQIGDHVHMCEHCHESHSVVIIDTSGEEVQLEAFSHNKDIKQPKYLILCPDCVAEFDPEEIYKYINAKSWDKKDASWLKTCHVIYQDAESFFELMYEILEEEAEELEEYEYEGPEIGEKILLCDHLKKSKMIDAGEVDYIYEDEKLFTIPKTKTKVRFVAFCDRCEEKTDSPLEVAKKKCRKKRLYNWKDTDLVKLCISDVGEQFVFSEGLAVEPLVNFICELFQKPEWFFDLNSPAWTLSKDWAPAFFETEALPVEEREVKYSSQEFWPEEPEVYREKHPTTKEEALVLENQTVVFDDFTHAVIIMVEFPILGKNNEEIAALEVEIAETESHLDMVAQNHEGIKYRMVTIPQRGWREFHYFFKNKFAAEEMENSLDDEFDVDIVELR